MNAATGAAVGRVVGLLLVAVIGLVIGLTAKMLMPGPEPRGLVDHDPARHRGLVGRQLLAVADRADQHGSRADRVGHWRDGPAGRLPTAEEDLKASAQTPLPGRSLPCRASAASS